MCYLFSPNTHWWVPTNEEHYFLKTNLFVHMCCMGVCMCVAHMCAHTCRVRDEHWVSSVAPHLILWDNVTCSSSIGQDGWPVSLRGSPVSIHLSTGALNARHHAQLSPRPWWPRPDRGLLQRKVVSTEGVHRRTSRARCHPESWTTSLLP